MQKLRVAVCADFPEEGWPSMDRVADRLVAGLAERHARSIAAERVCPPFRRRVNRVWNGQRAFNIDRGLNRLIDYPRYVESLAGAFDLFHIVDHSYAQLARRLPERRVIITCHDLDTFRSVLAPDEEPRSALFRRMTRHILDGFERAAIVACDTAAVRDELVRQQLAPAERTMVAPIGVSEKFSTRTDPAADGEARRIIAAPDSAILILHVGSTVPRKRLDIVLRCCGELRRRAPVHLVRVGGPFTAAQDALVRDCGIWPHVSVLPALSDALLAAVYRRAALVLLPSDREGFGLPVTEAMACGTPVLARDIPVLREVGGSKAAFVAGDDPVVWRRAVAALLEERSRRPDLWRQRQAAGVAWAAQFTWSRFADRMAVVYHELAGTGRAAVTRDRVVCQA